MSHTAVKVAKKLLLIILDGFGLSKDTTYNAIYQARTPNWDFYTKNYSFGKIDASSISVGLPSGQFGNSEVGHLNIGAGRKVLQDISRIDLSIKDETFFTNPSFVKAVNNAANGSIHILGLLSDGGVHCHIHHIKALIRLANNAAAIKHIYLHVFLDGRDTPPQSALLFLTELNDYIAAMPRVKIVTCSGRYYAMDRDKRYDRIELAYNAIMRGLSSQRSDDVLKLVTDSYALGLTDEFIKPTVLGSYAGVSQNDSMVFANFRSDRAILLTEAIVSREYRHFDRIKVELGTFVSMTCYDTRFKVEVAYPPVVIHNSLGQYLSSLGLKQLRITETEKYPHVTYFFNGGNKTPSPGEDWIMVDSPRDVATYDLKPEMSLPQVSEKLVDAIASEKYDVIITNFANADMVGHTGNLDAAVKAVEAIDAALGKVIPTMLNHGGEVLIISDHGNCEIMYDEENQQQHTQHTTSLVPFLYIGRNAKLLDGGALKDVAPSMLAICGLPQPSEMTGHNLIQFNHEI